MVSKVFTNIGYVLLLINCILLLKGFSKNGKPFKIFAFYCFAMFAVQMSATVLVKMHIQNLFLSHYYFILQFIVLSFFYHQLLREKFQKSIIVYTLIGCLAALCIQYIFDPSLYHRFNLFEIFITSLPLIVYATFHLYNLLNEQKEYYYINIGLLVYLFGSTIVFLTANLLISWHSKIPFRYVFDLNVYLYVVYQLFILFELRKILTHKKAENE